MRRETLRKVESFLNYIETCYPNARKKKRLWEIGRIVR